MGSPSGSSTRLPTSGSRGVGAGGGGGGRGGLLGGLLPLALLGAAIAMAAAATYGQEPAWGARAGGIDVILWSRRLQWPLLAVSLVCCVVVAALVASGKRRAWWLIGLGPVLALFAHHLLTGPMSEFRVADQPESAAVANVTRVADDDWVVGVEIGGVAYAYPYAQLWRTPVVLQTEREQRVLVLWSPYANHAAAFVVDRDLRAAELDVVSMPANALLVYNARYGEFINGLTGRTPGGKAPQGVSRTLAVTKSTWERWRQRNPGGRVMLPVAEGGPTSAVLPRYGVPGVGVPADERVVWIGAGTGIACNATEVGERPANLGSGDSAVVVFREPGSGRVRAFRRVAPQAAGTLRLMGQDAVPTTAPATTQASGGARVVIRLAPAAGTGWARRANGFMVDVDSGTVWSAGGLALDGDRARVGERLVEVPAQEDVFWGVIRHAFPGAELHAAVREDFAEPPRVWEAPKPPPPAKKPAIRRRR